MTPATLQNLSVFIIAQNEERNLPRCLASCQFAGEIIVVDSGSSDRTRDIAADFGAQVHTMPDWPGFGAQKNRALALCTREWVLNLDADEWVEALLAAEIGRLVQAGSQADCVGYAIRRRCRFQERDVYALGWWPHRVTRLWLRGKGRYEQQLVHERVALDGPLGLLDGAIGHEPYQDFWHLAQKQAVYGRVAAQELARRKRRVTWREVLWHGPWRFLRDYFIKRGFLLGVTGVAIALAQAWGTQLKYTLRWFDQWRTKRGLPSTLTPTQIPPAEEMQR